MARFSLFFLFILPLALLSQPKGFHLISGQAAFRASEMEGSELTSAGNTIVHWDEFSIGESEQFHFRQSNTTDYVLNRVVGSLKSEILGKLHSNGKVILINPQGIFIGAKGRIETAGLIATSLDLMEDHFLTQEALRFAGDTAGEVVHLGTIESAGDLFLLGPSVKNEGTLRGKHVGIGVGSSLLISPSGSERILIQIPVENGKLTHAGLIEAARVELKSSSSPFEKAIQCSGVIDATRLEERAGEIYLVGEKGICEVSGSLIAKREEGGLIHVLGEHVHLTSTSSVDASGTNGGTILIGGDYQGKNEAVFNSDCTWVEKGAEIRANPTSSGNGGKVILWSDGVTSFHGEIEAQGGALGGDGGFVEVSGKEELIFKGKVTTEAPFGKGGVLLLDPSNITISSSATTAVVGDPGCGGTGCNGNANAYSTAGGSASSIVNVSDLVTALNSNDVCVATCTGSGAAGTTGTITVSNALDWSGNTNTHSLTLSADLSISVSAAITAKTNANITMNANTAQTGTGTFSGITVAAAVTTTGTGTLSLTGYGSSNGLLMSAGGNLTSGNLVIFAVGGLNGVGGGAGASLHAGTITSTGNITITGRSTPTPAGGRNVFGISIQGTTFSFSGSGLTGTMSLLDCLGTDLEATLVATTITNPSGTFIANNSVATGATQNTIIRFGNSQGPAMGTATITTTGFLSVRTGFVGNGTNPCNITLTAGGGVRIFNGGNVRGVTGNVVINSSTTAGNGVQIDVNSGVSTTTGSISITGTTSDVAGSGVNLGGGAANWSVASTSGSITISGTNTSVASGSSGHGVYWTHNTATIGTTGDYTITGATSVTGSFPIYFGTPIATSITKTSGNLTFNGKMGLGTPTTITITSGSASKALTFNGDIANASSLTVAASTTPIIFTGNIGTTGARLTNLTFTSGGGVTLGPSNIFVDGGFAPGMAVNLAGTTSITTTNTAISLSSTLNGGNSLTLNPGTSTITLSGAAGGTTPIGALSCTTAGGIISTQAITTTGALSFDSTNGGATATGASISVNGAIAGATTLALRAGSGGAITLGGQVGTTLARLTGLTLSSGLSLSLGGNIYLTGTPLTIPMQTTPTGSFTIDTGP